jgi:hypothetical protein
MPLNTASQPSVAQTRYSPGLATPSCAVNSTGLYTELTRALNGNPIVNREDANLAGPNHGPSPI